LLLRRRKKGKIMTKTNSRKKREKEDVEDRLRPKAGEQEWRGVLLAQVAAVGDATAAAVVDRNGPATVALSVDGAPAAVAVVVAVDRKLVQKRRMRWNWKEEERTSRLR
jgi:hypothetical protein